MSILTHKIITSTHFFLFVAVVLCAFEPARATFIKETPPFDLSHQCSSTLSAANTKNSSDSLYTYLEQAEQLAFEAVFKTVLGKDQQVQYLNQWIQLISSKKDFTVAEHAALSFLYRNPRLIGIEISDSARASILTQLQVILKKSWKSLTNEDVSERQLQDRLPSRLLDGASDKTRYFYDISYVKMDNQESTTFQEMFRFLYSSRKEKKSLLVHLAVASAAFSVTGAEYMAAFLGGIAIFSISEHLFHRYLAHADLTKIQTLKENRNERLGLITQALEWTAINHQLVHHGPLSYTDYGEQFNSREQMERSDKTILKRMGDRFLETMKRTGYGLTIRVTDYLKLIAPFPVLTSLGFLVGIDPITLGLLLGPGFFYPIGLMSGEDFNHRYNEDGGLKPTDAFLLSFHEYSHLSREVQIELTNRRKWVRSILETKLAELARGLHEVHHDRPYTNFNLTNFIGDFLMGTLYLPNMYDLSRMDAEEDTGLFWGENILKTENE